MTILDAYTWMERWNDLAKFWGERASKDPDEKVGCVIVGPDGTEVALGYNGLPRGIWDTDGRLGQPDVKNQLTVHAELNAILNARRDLTGWALFVSKPPCLECAKAIIQAGINCVVCPPVDESSSWAWEQRLAQRLLHEAHVAGYNVTEEEGT